LPTEYCEEPNIISHAYDSIEPEIIWGIIQRDIPLLQTEINPIKGIELPILRFFTPRPSTSSKNPSSQ
jgi:hypothetical protein